jgi:hypothetical protein
MHRPLLALTALLLACTTPVATYDVAVGVDAATSDATTSDLGTSLDAAVTDAASIDAATNDAGTDASSGDANTDAAPPCHPVPNDCATGQQCIIALPLGTPYSCMTAGTATEGAACAARNDCAVGFGCYSVGGPTNTCFRYCRQGSNADCIGARTCMDAGFGSTYGICV